MLFLRDAGETEIGGFGICRPDALLDVEDFVVVPQRTTAVSVVFDDRAVADFFEDQVLQGRRPEEFARIWIHTHPGRCPQPSATDEATFARVFGPCDWALMFILAQGGATSARLAWNVGPRGAIEIPIAVDYSRPFPGSDHAAWQAEYDRDVTPHDDWFTDFDFGPPDLRPFRVSRPRHNVRTLLPHSPGIPIHVD